MTADGIEWVPQVRSSDEAASLLLWLGPDGRARSQLTVLDPSLRRDAVLAEMAAWAAAVLRHGNRDRRPGTADFAATAPADSTVVQLTRTRNGTVDAGHGPLNAPDDYSRVTVRLLLETAHALLTR